MNKVDTFPNQPLEKPGELKVGFFSIKLIGWIGMLLFTGFAIAAFVANQPIAVWIMLIIILLSAFLILAPGNFIFDEEGITWRNIFLTRRIYWSEIKTIEYGNQGDFLIRTDKKRLNVFPPSFWSGPYKNMAHKLFQRKLLENGFSLATSHPAGYKLTKNISASQNSGEIIMPKPLATHKQLLGTKAETFIVSLRRIMIFDWMAVAFFASITIAVAVLQPYDYLKYVFVILTICSCISAIVSVRTVIFDDKSVTCRSTLFAYRIYWNEVNSVELIPVRQKNTPFIANPLVRMKYALQGDNKCLVIPPPDYWSGPNKSAAYDFLQKKITERGLKPRESDTRTFSNTNVRVSRKNKG